MRSSTSAALFPLLWLLAGVAHAQVAPAGSTAPSAAAVSPTTPAPLPAPSLLLQPSLNNLQRTLGTLEVERWKLSRQAHDDARRNVDSIRQDMTATLPTLLSAADATPATVSAGFALLRNVDALYDVALRLSATAAIAAPGPQAAALDQALTDLLQARRALGDRTQTGIAGQEHAVADLQGKLLASAATPPSPCPAPAASVNPEKSKVRRSKPRPKPAPAPALQ